MTQRFDALYEKGVLRPLQPLEGFADRTEVTLSVLSARAAPRDWKACVGTLPDDDAAELRTIVEAEFARVDSDEW